MIHNGYDLPGALRVCDRLSTAWDRTVCTGGVFMENISTSYGFKSRWLRDDNFIYPCPIVASRHKLYCYLMVTSRTLPLLVGNDFGRTAAVCHRSEPGWATTCFQSLGRDASGQARGDVRRILNLCKPAADAMDKCLYGAARDLTYNDAGAKRAAGLCRQATGRCRRTASVVSGRSSGISIRGMSRGLPHVRGSRRCVFTRSPVARAPGLPRGG